MKLHIPFGGIAVGSFRSRKCGKKWGYLQGRNKLCSRKVTYDEVFQNLLESCLSFDGSNGEKMRAQQKEEVL